MDRFSRLEALIGKDRLDRLATRSVTIVGIGAVGGYVAEGLARSGIGRLRLVDFDVLSTSNINRQILALDSAMGQKKVTLAKQRIHEINPKCVVEALPLFAGDESMVQILSPAPDLVIDAIDSLNPKTFLLESAYKQQIPIISSMGAALRTDPSKIVYGDLFKSHGCPLARHLRRRLKRRGVDKNIQCVYSHEQVEFKYNEGITGPEDDGRTGRSRNILGSLPTIPGIFGLTIANQAILALAEEEIVLF